MGLLVFRNPLQGARNIVPFPQFGSHRKRARKLCFKEEGGEKKEKGRKSLLAPPSLLLKSKKKQPTPRIYRHTQNQEGRERLPIARSAGTARCLRLVAEYRTEWPSKDVRGPEPAQAAPNPLVFPHSLAGPRGQRPRNKTGCPDRQEDVPQ